MITFLVRHGDAGDKRRWDGPDAGRPLSPAGQGLVAPEPPALAEGFGLAAAPHRLAAGSYPLPVPAGTGPPTAHLLTGDERRLARSRHRGRTPAILLVR